MANPRAEGLSLHVVEKDSGLSRAVVVRGVLGDSEKHLLNDAKPVSIYLKMSSGRIVGGALARAQWGMLHLDYIWIEESLRGGGYGQVLLDKIEEFGLEQGCRAVIVDTFTFQAPDFYLHRKYEIFGEVEGYARGHKRYYLKKQLCG